MSKTVDERVVEMRFDNKQFESNVQTSMSTLDKLKQKLNLTGAAKGLEGIDTAAKKVDFSGMSNGIETVRSKFSALEVMGVTALANITNSAVNAGKRIASALTIDPIKSGFQEYETQINAVQTILANTQSKGTTLDDVNNALDTLNTYADKTIYNFTEMTRNIGTFTAAGIDLDTSVNAIQGIANLAAVSGSTSQQASTAMYQLSQALASGTVKLMDWNSVVNAGMSGQVFQDALKETARVHGIAIDDMIDKQGSFIKTLQEGWLTSDILTETLHKFTLTTEGLTEAEIEQNREMLRAKGYTEDQIEEIFKLGNTATQAATKVKTFTQLWDTLKEVAQSGWTQSWEIIVGDFEEAKELLTEISDTVGSMIGKSAEARNAVLQGWKDLGGRTALIDSFRNVFEGIGSIVKPISEAFREIFPPVTAQQLANFTEGLRDLTAKLKISDETAAKLKSTFKGLFSILDILKKAISTVAKAIANLLGSDGVSSLGGFLLDITASIGDFFTSLNEGFSTGGISGGLSKIVSGISNVLKTATKGLSGFGDILSSVGQVVSKVLGEIWETFKSVFSWITDNVSAGDIFAGLTGGGIFVLAKKFSGVFDKIKEVIENLFGGKGGFGLRSSVESFSDILDSVHESLKSFTTGIKASTLLAIAAAIGILAAALKSISELNAPDIGKSLLAIGAMLTMLTSGFKSIAKSLDKFSSKGIGRAGISLVLMAAAIKILADAMVKLSDLSLAEIGKGLFAVGGGIAELCGGLKIIGKTKVSLSTSVALLALAESCKILSDALVKFGDMSWGEISRGLTAMGGALGELVVAISILNKTGGFKSLLGSVGILIAVQSLDELSESLKKFGEMSWGEIGRGLTAMGGALGELGVVLGLLGKFAGFSSILASGAILIAVQYLDEITDALKSIGKMSWEEIGKGLSGMGGALGEISVATGALGKLAGFSSLLGSGSILIAVQSLDEIADALKSIGEMSWKEIGKGLSGMGGALGELGLVSGALGKLTGLSGILGSGSILLGVQGLSDLAAALEDFAKLSWDEIGRGLAAMGGALGELGLVSGVLGGLTNVFGLLGSGSLLLGIQGLDDLANALKKFGEMDWDEIGRGLAAMGGALGEIALGGFLNTLSIIGSYSISEIAEPLGVLADSVKKWTGVEVPDGLGLQLGLLASGVKAFTFGGFGASAIAEVAEPLGVLADSVMKWTDVIVPEGLGDQLKPLAEGVKAFTFGGFGASAIAEVAEPLGDLADSVNKWNGVTITEGLSEDLTSLADGIKSFTWGFMGGWSISTIVEPLGALPDSINKWSGISIPEGLSDDLTSLADGIKSFTWGFMGGWSLSTIVEPLGDLAGAVTKWAGVSIPEGLADDLTSLADGIKSFTLGFMGGWSLSTIIEPLGDLAGAVKKWNGVSIPEGLDEDLKSLADAVKAFAGCFAYGWTLDSVTGPLGDLGGAVKRWNGVDIPDGLKDDLTSLASGIKAFDGIPDISPVTSAITSIASSSSKLSGINYQSISTGLSTIVTAFKNLTSIDVSGVSILTSAVASLNKVAASMRSAASQFSFVGTSMADAITKGFRSRQSALTSAVNTMVRSALTAITSKASAFSQAGTMLTNRLVMGIKSQTSTITSVVVAAISSAASSIKAYFLSFYSAGVFLGSGLVLGIISQKTAAYNAGYALGQAAAQGEKDGQKSSSPSKLTIQAGKWLGEGLIIGINKMSSKVYNAGYDLGDSAAASMSSAIAKVSDVVDSDMDVQPTIRPVIDMSAINTSDMQIGTNISAALIGPIDTLSKLISDAKSDIKESNREVITAINELRSDLNMLYSSDNQEIALYVDSRKLTSALVNPMNKRLSVIANREGGL